MVGPTREVKDAVVEQPPALVEVVTSEGTDSREKPNVQDSAPVTAVVEPSAPKKQLITVELLQPEEIAEINQDLDVELQPTEIDEINGYLLNLNQPSGQLTTLDEMIQEEGKQHCTCKGAKGTHTLGCWALQDWVKKFEWRQSMISKITYFEDKLMSRKEANDNLSTALATGSPRSQHNCSLYNEDYDEGWETWRHSFASTNGFVMELEPQTPEKRCTQWMVATAGNTCNVHNHNYNPANQIPISNRAEKLQFCTNPEHTYMPFYHFHAPAEPACDKDTPDKTPVKGWPTIAIPLARSFCEKDRCFHRPGELCGTPQWDGKPSSADVITAFDSRLTWEPKENRKYAWYSDFGLRNPMIEDEQIREKNTVIPTVTVEISSQPAGLTYPDPHTGRTPGESEADSIEYQEFQDEVLKKVKDGMKKAHAKKAEGFWVELDWNHPSMTIADDTTTSSAPTSAKRTSKKQEAAPAKAARSVDKRKAENTAPTSVITADQMIDAQTNILRRQSMYKFIEEKNAKKEDYILTDLLLQVKRSIDGTDKDVLGSEDVDTDDDEDETDLDFKKNVAERRKLRRATWVKTKREIAATPGFHESIRMLFALPPYSHRDKHFRTDEMSQECRKALKEQWDSGKNTEGEWNRRFLRITKYMSEEMILQRRLTQLDPELVTKFQVGLKELREDSKYLYNSLIYHRYESQKHGCTNWLTEMKIGDIREVVECVCAYAENRHEAIQEPREDDEELLNFNEYIDCMATTWKIFNENEALEHFRHLKTLTHRRELRDAFLTLFDGEISEVQNKADWKKNFMPDPEVVLTKDTLGQNTIKRHIVPVQIILSKEYIQKEDGEKGLEVPVPDFLSIQPRQMRTNADGKLVGLCQLGADVYNALHTAAVTGLVTGDDPLDLAHCKKQWANITNDVIAVALGDATHEFLTDIHIMVMLGRHWLQRKPEEYVDEEGDEHPEALVHKYAAETEDGTKGENKGLFVTYLTAYIDKLNRIRRETNFDTEIGDRMPGPTKPPLCRSRPEPHAPECNIPRPENNAKVLPIAILTGLERRPQMVEWKDSAPRDGLINAVITVYRSTGLKLDETTGEWEVPSNLAESLKKAFQIDTPEKPKRPETEKPKSPTKAQSGATPMDCESKTSDFETITISSNDTSFRSRETPQSSTYQDMEIEQSDQEQDMSESDSEATRSYCESQTSESSGILQDIDYTIWTDSEDESPKLSNISEEDDEEPSMYMRTHQHIKAAEGEAQEEITKWLKKHRDISIESHLDPFELTLLPDNELEQVAKEVILAMQRVKDGVPRGENIISNRVLRITQSLTEAGLPIGWNVWAKSGLPPYLLNLHEEVNRNMGRATTRYHSFRNAIFVRPSALHQAAYHSGYIQTYGEAYSFLATPANLAPDQLNYTIVRKYLEKQWGKVKERATRGLHDPFCTNDVDRDLLIEKIMNVMGRPGNKEFRADTLIVLQGNPFLRNKARTNVVTRDADRRHFTKPWMMVSEGVVATPKDSEEEESADRDYGIQEEGSYLMMTAHQPQPITRQNMSQMILEFLRDEEEEAGPKRHFTRDPFSMNSYGYRRNEEVASTVMSYFLDHPERADGVLPEFQFCLLGTEIPYSVKMHERRIQTAATQSFVRATPELMYRRKPDWNVTTTVIVEKDIVGTHEWDKLLHQTFVPEEISRAEDTITPINIHDLREQVIEWLTNAHASAYIDDRDPYGHWELDACDIHYLAGKIVKEFQPTSGLCKSIAPSSITIRGRGYTPGDFKTHEVPWASETLQHRNHQVQAAVLFRPTGTEPLSHMTAPARMFTSQELLRAQRTGSPGDIEVVKDELKAYLENMKKRAIDTKDDPYELTNIPDEDLTEFAHYMASFLWTTESKPHPTADIAFIVMGYDGRTAEADTANHPASLKDWQKSRMGGTNRFFVTENRAPLQEF